VCLFESGCESCLPVGALGLGLLAGAPMRPDEIEEPMHRMNQPKLACTLRREEDEGDPLRPHGAGRAKRHLVRV
jgi:hypothetical protein